ncbi:uncharacterized protein TrAtP1_012581 [Trichoderma atroviride]|uniref:Ubiquitin-like protease family profile domain-containing protein n=1 Tax=Hypocrea atroviridis (strain ATCC 20476 / IMI 206040) TaxID=452589 RepID=G9NU27_HYPAI|nr:uncharacterized protein TRIATDRAFT_317727 [Trichoderma atroviride IMI 206040]EHK45563.1 hypothetical protein TRIATDRAFT_317727 [Trichoderma atroviride IMI 206040]UKZ71629.1 hypothetical protein TrAtP1_012581 [Trichoderma atroviride]
MKLVKTFSCELLLVLAMAFLVAVTTVVGLGRFAYNQCSNLFSYEAAQASDGHISASDEHISASDKNTSTSDKSISAVAKSISTVDKTISTVAKTISASEQTTSISNKRRRHEPLARLDKRRFLTTRSSSITSGYMADVSRSVSDSYRSNSQVVLSAFEQSALELSRLDNQKEIPWLDKQASANLIKEYKEFVALFEFVWKSSMSSAQPALVDECLLPIRMHFLVPEKLQLHDRGLLSPLNAAFEEFCILCIVFLNKVYCIDRITYLREKWPTAPSFMDEQPSPKDVEMMDRMRGFFSFPGLPGILSNVLAICGFDNIEMPADFMDRIVTDLGAIIRRRTVPSYVASEAYRERLRVLEASFEISPLFPSKSTSEVTSEETPENEPDIWLQIAEQSDHDNSYQPSAINSDMSFNPSCYSLSGLPSHPVKKRVSFELPSNTSDKASDKIEELMSLPSLSSLKISEDSEIELRNLRKEAEALRQLDLEQEKLRKLQERTANGPQQPVVAPLSDEWIQKASETVFAPDTDVLATTCQGTPLRRHDFATVVAAKTWLNDEIVNGALGGLEKEINLVAGITDYKKQGRKCLVMNSFFWPRVEKARGRQTQSILRRMGVTPQNFLLMDTVLIPICKDFHWTLLVLQPKSKKIMHLDSFNRSSSHPDMALAWISDYLGELYLAQEWEVMVVKSPQQSNGYDCGVHVITNGICMALGLEPVASYCVEEMPLQRLRIAGMLLNGGLNGEFDLWKH